MKLKQIRLSLLDVIQKTDEDFRAGIGFYDTFGEEDGSAEHQNTETLLINMRQLLKAVDALLEGE